MYAHWWTCMVASAVARLLVYARTSNARPRVSWSQYMQVSCRLQALLFVPSLPRKHLRYISASFDIINSHTKKCYLLNVVISPISIADISFDLKSKWKMCYKSENGYTCSPRFVNFFQLGVSKGQTFIIFPLLSTLIFIIMSRRAYVSV